MADFNNYQDNGNYGQGSFENYDLGSDYQANAYYKDAMAPSLTLSNYIARTFLWMFVGLTVTFIVAMGMVFTGTVYSLLAGAGSLILIGVLILQLVVVGVLSVRVRKLSVGAARGLFLLYAALNGFAFSVYFVSFGYSVLIYAFGATALMFGGMAAASLIFNLQLDSIRPFLFGGLIMLLVFGVIGAFLNLGAFDIFLCYIGIAVFMGYTAYDTSKIKDNYYYYTGTGNQAMLQKASIFSALQLYLDFVNLLLYIIRLLSRTGGNSRK